MCRDLWDVCARNISLVCKSVHCVVHLGGPAWIHQLELIARPALFYGLLDGNGVLINSARHLAIHTDNCIVFCGYYAIPAVYRLVCCLCSYRQHQRCFHNVTQFCDPWLPPTKPPNSGIRSSGTCVKHWCPLHGEDYVQDVGSAVYTPAPVKITHFYRQNAKFLHGRSPDPASLGDRTRSDKGSV